MESEPAVKLEPGPERAWAQERGPGRLPGMAAKLVWPVRVLALSEASVLDLGAAAA